MGRAVVIAAVVVGVVVVIMIVAVVVVRLLEGPTVRRRELAELRRKLDLAESKLERVRAAADEWSDVESVLATRVRAVLRETGDRARS